MASALQDFIIRLDELGVTDVMLPFLLIFTIFFAILQKTRILGENKKNMNMAVALVIALIVVVPHVTGAYPSDDSDPVVIMNRALPGVSIVVVAIVMLLILIGLFGGEYKMFGWALSGWVTLFSVILIVFIFGAAANWWNGWEWIELNFGEDALSMVLILVVFGLMVAFVTSEPKADEKDGYLGRLQNDLKSVFGGSGGGGGGGHH